jgi:tetratricopeptide (TPR) repeat protein
MHKFYQKKSFIKYQNRLIEALYPLNPKSNLIITQTAMTKSRISSELLRSFKLLLFIIVNALIVSCSPISKIMKDKNVCYFEGYTYIDESDDINAVEKLTRKIERDSLNADALNARGFCYLRQGRWPDALADYNKAVQVSPSVTEYVNRSIVNRKLGNYEDAYSDLRNASELDSSNIYLDFNYGSFYMEVRDYERAIQHFLKSNQVNESFRFTALYNIARCYRYLNNFEKSIEYYNAALAIYPYSAPIYNNLGIIYMLTGNNEKGIASFLRAKKLDVNFYSPYYNLGNAYFNSGKFREATEEYEKALTLTKDDNNLVVIYCNLSRIMFLTRDYRGSINYGNKLLQYKSNPDLGKYYYIALYNLAICNLKLSEFDIAYKLYNDCFEDGAIREHPELVDEVCGDLTEHYKLGLDQKFVEDILLNVVKITKEDFNNRLNNN